MSRPLLRGIVLAIIFLFVGVATAAAVYTYVPDPGSAPSVFDDFNFSSTSNGFWHVNAVGASVSIKHGIATLSGDSVELDHRVQTDPKETVIVTKIRGISFDKFSIGLGQFHAGTVGMEFDQDGLKCGRATDHGWQVNYLKGWTKPPIGKWFYLVVAIVNPYPNRKDTPKVPKAKLKPITLTCAAYDQAHHLIAKITPTQPPANTHYVSLDETFMRTWDSHNEYQVDWFYTGPRSGSPVPIP